MGFIEAKLSFPMGPHVFKTEALLLFLPTTEYQQRVPVMIGTSLTDMVVDSLGSLDLSKLSTTWKPVCFTTQSRRKIQTQLQKSTVVTNTRMYLPQVHWGSYQTLIWFLLVIYWVYECGISMTCEYICGVYLWYREEPLI